MSYTFAGTGPIQRSPGWSVRAPVTTPADTKLQAPRPAEERRREAESSLREIRDAPSGSVRVSRRRSRTSTVSEPDSELQSSGREDPDVDKPVRVDKSKPVRSQSQRLSDAAQMQAQRRPLDFPVYGPPPVRTYTVPDDFRATPQATVGPVRQPSGAVEWARSRLSRIRRRAELAFGEQEDVRDVFAAALRVDRPTTDFVPARQARRDAIDFGAEVIGAVSTGGASAIGRRVVTHGVARGGRMAALRGVLPEATLFSADATRRGLEVSRSVAEGETVGSAVGDAAARLAVDAALFGAGGRASRTYVPDPTRAASGVRVDSRRFVRDHEFLVDPATGRPLQVRQDLTTVRGSTTRTDVLGNVEARPFEQVSVRNIDTGSTVVWDYTPGRSVRVREFDVPSLILAQDRTTGFRQVRVGAVERGSLFDRQIATVATGRDRGAGLFLRGVTQEERLVTRAPEISDRIILGQMDRRFLRSTALVGPRQTQIISHTTPQAQVGQAVPMGRGTPFVLQPRVDSPARVIPFSANLITTSIGRPQQQVMTATQVMGRSPVETRPSRVAESFFLEPEVRRIEESRPFVHDFRVSDDLRMVTSPRTATRTPTMPRLVSPPITTPDQPTTPAPPAFRIRTPQRTVTTPFVPPGFPRIPPTRGWVGMPGLFDFDLEWPEPRPQRRRVRDTIRSFDRNLLNVPSLTASVFDSQASRRRRRKTRTSDFFIGTELRF